MEDTENFVPLGDEAGESASKKSKILEGMTQAAQPQAEDASRGVLHYGDTYEGGYSRGTLPDSGLESPGFTPSDEQNVSERGEASSSDTPIVDGRSADVPSNVMTDLPAASGTDEHTQPASPTEATGDDQPVTAAFAPAPDGPPQDLAGPSLTSEPADVFSQPFQPSSGPTQTPTTQATSAPGPDSKVGVSQSTSTFAAGGPDDAPATGASVTDDVTTDEADLNAAPTSVSLDGATVAENAAGAVVGTLSVVDPDAGDSHSFAVSDDRFEVVDGTVKLKDGISLDHEEAATLDLTVTATDEGGASVSESFVIDVADVNEGPTSVSLDGATVAENAAGAVVGTLSVVDPDAGDSHSFAVSDDRFEVVDGTVKLKDGVSLDHEEAATLDLTVTATDQGGASVTESFAINVAEMPDVAVDTGFHVKFYDMDTKLTKLDDIDWDSEPTHQELTDQINYENSTNSFWEGGSKDTFGAKITGNIEVDEAGTFDFYLGGDDGAVLFVNGAPVIDNDGLHGFRTRSGEIELEPGTHTIEVRYFENGGSAGLKLEWEGPGIDGRELVTAPQMDDLQTVNGMPVSLNVSTSEVDGAEIAQSLQGLPEGTTVSAGDDVAVVGADQSVDITGWNTALLDVTPPVDFVGTIEMQIETVLVSGEGQGAVATQDVTLEVDQATIPSPDISVHTGFTASYYDMDHSLKKLDDVDWEGLPSHEEIVSDINYSNGFGSFWEGGATDTFGAKLTGDVAVEEGGTFTFHLGGDDGVVLLINGEEVVNGDGLHAYKTFEAEVELEPGVHQIEVRYFENYRHAGLKLEWEGPGIEGKQLVTAQDDLAVSENGTIDIGIPGLDLSDAAQVVLSGLPDGTIVSSGGHIEIAEGGTVDVSGWNIDMIEVDPPANVQGVFDVSVTVKDLAFNGEEWQQTETIELSVGVDEMGDAGPDNWAEFMLIADADNGTESPDVLVDGSADDVMSESVALVQESEAQTNLFETNEIQQW